MMSKVTNFIANVPLYVGVVLQKTSEKLYDLSIRLHLLLSTELGQKIAKVQKDLKDLAEQYEAAKAAETTKKEEPNKLYSAIVGKQAAVAEEDLPEGVVSLGKKRSKSKD